MNKNSIVSPLKNHIDKFLFGLSLLTLVSVLVLRFFFLDRGLIFSDEGWYLCLLRDLPTDDGSTKYHLLFKNIFNNNIYAIRVACYLLMLVSSIVFAAGLYNYLNKKLSKKTNFIYCLGVIYMGQMSVIACPSFNYITLNISIAELSIGLLLLFLSNQKIIYSLLSGFFIGFLFPVMITNVIVIPIMIIVLFCLSEKKWKSVLFFLIGIALFFGFYFAVIESPSHYFASILGETNKTINRGSSDYGLLFLVKWLGKSFYYLIRQLTVAFAIVFCLQQDVKTSKKRMFMYLILAIMIVFTSVYLYPAIRYNWQRTNDIYWILIFVFLFGRKILFDNNTLFLFGLLLLMPICLSFGTNVPFQIRQGTYFMFLTPLLFLLPQLNYKWKGVLAVLFTFLWATFVFSVFFKSNWHGDIFWGQNHKLTEIGINQNIKVDNKQLEKVKFCKERVTSGDNLYIFYREYWGIAALLDVTVISHTFNPAEQDMMSVEKTINDSYHKDKKTIWIVFEDNQVDLLTSIVCRHEYKLKKYQLGNMVLAKIENANGIPQ